MRYALRLRIRPQAVCRPLVLLVVAPAGGVGLEDQAARAAVGMLGGIEKERFKRCVDAVDLMGEGLRLGFA